MNHTHLSNAKVAKNDEFYTRYEDIASEVQRYDLRGMSVYCNCDDAESAFIKYFIENFHQHGLKKLYASGIRGEYIEYDGKHILRKRINGDFRSDDCKAILEKADVCITNPPFSLFREYIGLVPNFLIVGNKNAISYKELFPMLKDGRCKLGYTHPNEFYTPDGSLVNLNGLCRWFTSMMVNKAPPPIIGRNSPCYLRCYDNYPAINIDRVEDIPDNYDGLMGVPITFMDYMDYQKFEIVDLIARYAVIDKSHKVKRHQLTEIDGEPKYSRIIIKIKMNNNENKTGAGVASVTEQPRENGVVETPNAKVVVSAPTKQKKVKAEKSYEPSYSDDEKKQLQTITKVCEDEIARIILDDNIGAVPYADETNCIIDLRKIHDRLYSPLINRTHGSDQAKTGETLRMFGAQHILLVLTVPMAKAAGLLPGRFSNDPQKDKPVEDDGFVLLDGNGRINYLMAVPKEQWPAIFAVFPSKDACGMYNLNKSFDIINTQVSVWKTQDMVQKRLLMDSGKAHPGWNEIQNLIQKGYKYQAACQLVTLETDRIKKEAVTGGDAKNVFRHFESAMKIKNKLVEVFGDDTDTLKTKEFTKEISSIWNRLQVRYADETATTYFLEFINKHLTQEIVESIKKAKSEKNGIKKDERRKKILNEEFFTYKGSKGIQLN